MVAIRATYDGEKFTPLPSESLPKVDGEVQVAIVFWEEPVNGTGKTERDDETLRPRPAREWEAARRMRAARDAMEPLGCTSKELIEEDCSATGAPTVQDSQREIAEQLWAIRASLPPLGLSIPELIEEGRER